MPNAGPADPATLGAAGRPGRHLPFLRGEVDGPDRIGCGATSIRRARVHDAVDEDERWRPGAWRKERHRRFGIGAIARQHGMEQSVGADRVDRIDAAERNRRDGRRIRHGWRGHGAGRRDRSPAPRASAAGRRGSLRTAAPAPGAPTALPLRPPRPPPPPRPPAGARGWCAGSASQSTRRGRPTSSRGWPPVFAE